MRRRHHQFSRLSGRRPQILSLAAKATGQAEVEYYAAMGREFLLLAHRAADVVSVPEAPSFWHKAS